MKAILLDHTGDAHQLQLAETETPTIQEGEVLVQVKAISINPVDIKTRNGKGIYGRIKEQMPLILGWDISGVVIETSSNNFGVGDEVFGNCRNTQGGGRILSMRSRVSSGMG